MERPFYRYATYVAFGVVSFLVSLMLTFPDSQVRKIAAVQIENRLEQQFETNYNVEIDNLDFWWLLGVELEGLLIEEAAPPGAEQMAAGEGEGEGEGEGDGGGDGEASDEEGYDAQKKKKKGGDSSGADARTSVKIASIAGRLAPLSSAWNLGLSVRYYLGLGGGSIEGNYIRAGDAQYVTVSVDDVDFNESPLLEQVTNGVPMYGTFYGSGEFQMAAKRPVLTGGQFELHGRKFTIGPKEELRLEAIPFGHVNVPETNFGNLDMRLNVESEKRPQPRLVVEKFHAEGRDLEWDIWGHVQLAGRLARAEAQLKTRLSFNQKFVQDNDAVRAVLRNQKFQNGNKGSWYGLVVWGPFANLQWKGSPTAADGPKAANNKGGGEASDRAGKKGKKRPKRKKRKRRK